MAEKTLECGCIVTLTPDRIEDASEELIRRIVCPHSKEADFLTKAGEYDLTVKTISKGTIESHINIPV